VSARQWDARECREPIWRRGASRGRRAPAPPTAVDNLRARCVDETLPADLADLLAGGDAMLARVRDVVNSGAGRRALSDVRLGPPIARPQKFLAVGLNYADHVAEDGQELPEFPTVFAKMPSCVNGPYADIVLPAVSDKVD